MFLRFSILPLSMTSPLRCLNLDTRTNILLTGLFFGCSSSLALSLEKDDVTHVIFINYKCYRRASEARNMFFFPPTSFLSALALFSLFSWSLLVRCTVTLVPVKEVQ